MITATIVKSKIPDKKYTIIVLKNGIHRTLHIGSKPYQDYTQHKNPERRKAYIQRHSKREDWNNPLTNGFWSRWLLWEKPSIEEAIKNIETKFNIKIKF